MKIATDIKKRKKVGVCILILSALTLFFPKEMFDPHIGTDCDIFCRLMSEFGQDIADNIEPLNIEYTKSIIDWIKIEIIFFLNLSEKKLIRAPPRRCHA